MSEAAESNSVAWLVTACPERVRGLFAALELDRKGLEQVRDLVAREDWTGAGDALLAYYRDGTSGAWLRRAPVMRGKAADPAADPLLQDIYTFYDIAGTVPRRADGGLHWQYCGPNSDFEWALALNRHQYMGTLLKAYVATGNPDYARGLDALIRDWVLANPYAGQRNADAAWRGLEVSFRPKAWAPVFFGLLADPEFSPATRLLLLSSLPEHADYLRRFHSGGNWATMELSGLALIAAAWPEFKQAPEWMDYARRTLTAEMSIQNYPDGVQKELTSHYHWVALGNFEHFAATLRHAGRTVPEAFVKGLEGMWHYQAYSLQPDGMNPLNNDSDRSDYRGRLLGAAKTYGRPDWAYIASQGAKGSAPTGVPSLVFPWAGQVIMRSGWQAKAQYAFFDAGPWGISHQHSDKLHLSVSAGGRELLVDGGRYSYVGSPWRTFFTGSASHNTVLVDGRGQGPDVREATAPLEGTATALLPDLDYARAAFLSGYEGVAGTATHTRAVVYLRGKYWVVFDRIETDRPRQLEALWHFSPACTVAEEGGSLVTTDAGRGNLRLVPVAGQPWQMRLVSGQESPEIQGWYSVSYNLKAPAACAVYSLQEAGTTVCAWVLAPGEGPAPAVTATWLPAPEGAARLSVALAGQPATEFAVRLAGTGAVPLSGGLQLEGACAVLRAGQPPLAVHGKVVDAQGRVLAAHPVP